MPDADASAAFDLEDDSLSAGLDAIAAKFEAIATQINSGFAGANAQLTATAASAASVGAQAGSVQRLGAGLALAAQAARTVTTAFSGIVVTASRIAPFVKFIPDSLGKWVPPLKSASAEFVKVSSQIGVVVKSAQALTGRLTALNAGFLALDLRAVGASRTMAVFGAAGALAMSKTVAGARGAMGAVAALGGALASATRRTMGGIGGAIGGVTNAVGTVTSFAAPMAGMALMMGPLGAAAAATAGAFAGLGKSLASAGEMQSFTASMATLLGGTDAARSRMEELNKFAAETPFDLPGVVKASKVLQTLTNGALATGDGLRMVGDIASVSGQPFEDIAVHVGRLYDGLMNGRPVGESMQRLQELGLVSAATRTKLEALQGSGAKGQEVWSVAAQSLMRFSGEMARQSSTWGGIMSNFGDGVGRIFQAIGEPLIAGLSPFMTRMNAWLGTLIPWAQQFGRIVAGWGALIAQIFADGKAGQALGVALKVGFMEAVNFLLRALVGAGQALIELMTSGNTWEGMSNALMTAGQALMVVIMEGLANALDAMRDLPFVGSRAGSMADKLHDSAAAATEGTAQSASAAADQFSALMPEMGAAFSKGFSETGNLLDSSGAKKELMDVVHESALAAQQAVTDASKAAERGNLPTAKPDPNAEDAAVGKGKKGPDVAALQKIAGGGGGGRDPLLNTAKSQLDETKKTNVALAGLTKAVSGLKIGSGVPVFG